MSAVDRLLADRLRAAVAAVAAITVVSGLGQLVVPNHQVRSAEEGMGPGLHELSERCGVASLPHFQPPSGC